MLKFMAFILAIFADSESDHLIAIADFPTQGECGEVLPHLYYDAVCTPAIGAAPITSPRPKRNPIYGGV